MAKRKNDDTTLPPIPVSLEDAMKALLRTPPPPVGHPSTRKKPPVDKKGAKKR